MIYQSNCPPLFELGRTAGTDVFLPLSAAAPDLETYPGLLMVATEGRMNFVSTPHLADKMQQMVNAAGRIRHLAIANRKFAIIA